MTTSNTVSIETGSIPEGKGNITLDTITWKKTEHQNKKEQQKLQ